jgi:hypothetical protein
VPAIVKDKNNPFFKSKYSDLAGVLNGISETMAMCELAVIHKMSVNESSNVLTTILIHSSGESIESSMVLPQVVDPQKLGSMLTYYRRYALMSILGVASEDEDDDGNKASNKSEIQSPNMFKEYPASEKQINLIKSLCDQVGEKVPEIKDAKHASRIIERLNELQKEKKSKSVRDLSFKLGDK